MLKGEQQVTGRSAYDMTGQYQLYLTAALRTVQPDYTVAATFSLVAGPKIHGTSLMYHAADWIWKI